MDLGSMLVPMLSGWESHMGKVAGRCIDRQAGGYVLVQKGQRFIL